MSAKPSIQIDTVSGGARGAKPKTLDDAYAAAVIEALTQLDPDGSNYVNVTGDDAYGPDDKGRAKARVRAELVKRDLKRRGATVTTRVYQKNGSDDFWSVGVKPKREDATDDE